MFAIIKKCTLAFLVLSACSQFCLALGEDDPAPDIDKIIEEKGKQVYGLDINNLPDEMVAAVLVKLEPADLITASAVSKKWKSIALRVIEGNLNKWGVQHTVGGVFVPYDLTRDQNTIVRDFKKYAPSFHYSQCPQIIIGDYSVSFGDAKNKDIKDNFNRFVQAINTATVRSPEKLVFNFDGKLWFIDTVYKDLFKQNLEILKGNTQHISKYAAASGMGNPVVKEMKLVAFEKIDNRNRCIYAVKIRRNIWVDDDEGSFRMTFLD